MKCDRYEVLYQVVRIANSSLDLARTCKSLLRLLQQTLRPNSLTLFLLATNRASFARHIESTGPAFFLPCSRRPSATLDVVALQSRQPIQEGDLWCFPVYSGRQNFGVLHLQMPPGQTLPTACQDAVRIAGEEMAKLLRLEQSQKREGQCQAQFSILAELGLELNRADTFDDLLEIGLPILLRHRLADCAILRPLHAGALLGEGQLRLRPACAEAKDLFLLLEEEHAAAALTKTQPFFRRLPARLRRGKAVPAEMVFIPLVIRDRVFGILSLFGTDGASGLPLTATAGARQFFAAVGAQFAQALDRIGSREHLEALSRENDRKLQETALLYRISRAIHSAAHLDELMHLILSAAVAPGGGGFERAMLFTINERTETLQGILCITQDRAALVIPPENRPWEKPKITAEMQQELRNDPDCQKVMKQRLSLDAQENPLARCARSAQVIFVAQPQEEPGLEQMVESLRLSPFACAPLIGHSRALGVLVVDNPRSQTPPSSDRRHFLEMFANQAGTAMQNSMLLHRLQTAHQDLRETQARLIHGEKMATLGEMAASIAHELRNPLVPIGGFAERLARMAADGSHEKEYAGIISREVRRMEGMLANILVFSKRQMLCFGECRVFDIIEEALDLEAEALERAAIEVRTEMTEDLPAIQCDHQKLRQVLINLITNARQAMPEGGRLVLRAKRGKLRGESAVDLEVEDTGGGVSNEVLRNIFNPFFTTKEKGTGLGLSISHRIIEHHRGEIEVKNRERGAAFILHLPTNPNFTSQH